MLRKLIGEKAEILVRAYAALSKADLRKKVMTAGFVDEQELQLLAIDVANEVEQIERLGATRETRGYVRRAAERLKYPYCGGPT